MSVIAGEAMGQKAVIETRTPIIYLHYRIEPGGVAKQQVPSDYNAFAYIVEGEGLFGAEGERATDGQMVLFAQDGDEVRIENPIRSESYARSVAHRRCAFERASRALWTVCNEHRSEKSIRRLKTTDWAGWERLIVEGNRR